MKSEEELIKSMIKSYIIFHDQFDLEATNTLGLEDKVEYTKKDLKKILKVVDAVDSLPCNDPLWDRYMEQDVIDWLEDTDFSIEDWLEDEINSK